MKQGLVLDKVVLLGRTFEEYVRCFALDRAALRGQAILDVASGVSSFCAEAHAQGLDSTAFDLIYEQSLEEIEALCGADVELLAGGAEALPRTVLHGPPRPLPVRQTAP